MGLGKIKELLTTLEKIYQTVINNRTDRLPNSIFSHDGYQ